MTTDLHTPYTLTDEQIATFRRDGFIKLKDVFSAEVLAHYSAEITRLVKELNTEDVPLAERDTYRKAFLQVMNLWEHSDTVKEFVLGRRLGKIAADLLGTDGVRLYHDQALYKEAGGGITPWHADQFYWPLATDRAVTVWIPLQETPVAMGALEFCAGSQHQDFGRDLPITDESEAQIQQSLTDANFDVVREPFALGEVSFHLGWTFHRAGPNETETPRAVMTIIYMDSDMKLAQPTNDMQVSDWHTWCPGARVGDVIDTPKNLLIYSRE